MSAARYKDRDIESVPFIARANARPEGCLMPSLCLGCEFAWGEPLAQ